jgi:hypothetical protein
VFASSEELLRKGRAAHRDFAESDHQFIGEQLGVERVWIVKALGDGEVAEHCANALSYMQHFLDGLYELCGGHFPIHYIPKATPARIYFETDADPTLGERWGWSPPPLGPLRRRQVSESEFSALAEEVEKVLQSAFEGKTRAKDP